jgi:hypothetical protein
MIRLEDAPVVHDLPAASPTLRPDGGRKEGREMRTLDVMLALAVALSGVVMVVVWVAR